VAGTVAWISIAPVKGLALQQLEEVQLDRTGVTANRRFYLVDGDGRLRNGKQLGRLTAVEARFDEEANTLELRLPDGAVVTGLVTTDGAVETSFYGRAVTGSLVVGPWAEALSAWAGVPLRLVQPQAAGAGTDRGAGAGVTLVSTSALDALARVVGAADVDGRRFRMLFGVDGIAAHEEDSWLAGEVRIGEALVELHGNVGRCSVTTQNPDTGEPDLDTLRALASYRGELETTERLPFGVWGSVVRPGRVRLGDPVEPV
jgi:uncharacterized protein YcbX